MNYEDDMYIYENALDYEILEQPTLAMKYGKHWAECQERFTRAEENVKVIRAELIQQVHENPDEHLGDVKPTAPVVESYYRNHRRHKRAKEEWIKAQYELNMAEVAKWEISNSRKQSLEQLVKLHGQQYFAGPSVPHDLTELRTEKRDEISHRIGSTLKRKPKEK